METDIPEILSDLRIGADAWCGVQEPVAHALTHDDIQDAVAEYLAAGGVITTILLASLQISRSRSIAALPERLPEWSENSRDVFRPSARQRTSNTARCSKTW